jgi:hypothetical protein
MTAFCWILNDSLLQSYKFYVPHPVITCLHSWNYHHQLTDIDWSALSFICVCFVSFFYSCFGLWTVLACLVWLFLAQLTLQSWRWWWYVPLKHWAVPELLGVTRRPYSSALFYKQYFVHDTYGCSWSLHAKFHMSSPRSYHHSTKRKWELLGSCTVTLHSINELSQQMLQILWRSII